MTVAKAAGFNSVIDDQSVIRINNTTVKEINYDQIIALMASLSPAQRNRPWSMDELVARIQGRYSARPHPMHVGTALRQLGWTSFRDWSVSGGCGRRVWRLDQE